MNTRTEQARAEVDKWRQRVIDLKNQAAAGEQELAAYMDSMSTEIANGAPAEKFGDQAALLQLKVKGLEGASIKASANLEAARAALVTTQKSEAQIIVDDLVGQQREVMRDLAGGLWSNWRHSNQLAILSREIVNVASANGLSVPTATGEGVRQLLWSAARYAEGVLGPVEWAKLGIPATAGPEWKM